MKTKTILIIAGIFILVSMVSFGFVNAIKINPTNEFQILNKQPLISGYKVPVCITPTNCGYAIVPISLAYGYTPNQNNFPLSKVIGEAKPIYLEYNGE